MQIYTSNEQGVTREYDTFLTILHEIADTILRMARRMESFYGDALSDLECLSMGRSLRHRLTILTPDNGEFVAKDFELRQLVTTFGSWVGRN